MCRSRQELSNAYLLAKFDFDTAENEPSKVCRADVQNEQLGGALAVEVPEELVQEPDAAHAVEDGVVRLRFFSL